MIEVDHGHMPPRESKKKKTRETDSSEKETDLDRGAPAESVHMRERGSEVLEHAKSLESKIQKLKEHAIDADEIAEIEGILKDAKGYFAKFSDKKEKGKSVDQLEERRKIAEQKLMQLNQRMVQLLEKMGQPVPEAFTRYTTSKSDKEAIVKSIDEEKVHAKKREAVAEIGGVDVIQPREDDSEGSLGDSEIGGINEIVVGEVEENTPQEKSVESDEFIHDSIQIRTGGKTYEFGWHEQVVYETAKGNKLECIVLGKSKNENKPGLILKDLEKGKVFAVGADSIVERVDVRDREVGKSEPETNQKQVVEDEDIFGLKDQPKREETTWPEGNEIDTREESERKMRKVIGDAKEDLRDEMKNDYTEFKERQEKKKLVEADTIFKREKVNKSRDAERKRIGTRAANGSQEKGEILMKKKDGVWVHENEPDGFLGIQEQEEKLKESERKKRERKEKYEAELQLPSVIVDDEQVSQPDQIKQEEPVVLKGDEFIEKWFPKKSTSEKIKGTGSPVSDLPPVMVDEEYQEYRPPVAPRERKTYPEVSEKQALKMIDSVDEALEKAWGGMHMTVVEKQKTGWFRSKQVEREMTEEERKAQLEAWLDTIEQAFDSLDKKKDGTNLEKPILAWHKAQTLMRKLGIELGQVGKEIQNAEFKRAFNTMNAEVVEAGVRLEEKKEKRDNGKSRIPNWARRTILGTLGALAIGNAETNRGGEVVAAAQAHSEKALQSEDERSETVGESQRNMLSFLADVNKMMTENALSATPFVIDSELASEIKSGKEGIVPGLVGAEISSDGKSVELKFDNNKTAKVRAEKVMKAGKEQWKLNLQEKKDSKIGQGEKTLAELKQVLADAKKQYPDIFGTEASKPRQKKSTTTLEAEIEKRLRKAEADPESREGRREIEEVKKMIDEVKSEVVVVSEAEPKLPSDVFERFNREVTFDPKADALFEEWGNARNALKAAQEAGDPGKIKKSNEELRNVIEKITKEYSK